MRVTSCVLTGAPIRPSEDMLTFVIHECPYECRHRKYRHWMPVPVALPSTLGEYGDFTVKDCLWKIAIEDFMKDNGATDGIEAIGDCSSSLTSVKCRPWHEDLVSVHVAHVSIAASLVAIGDHQIPRAALFYGGKGDVGLVDALAGLDAGESPPRGAVWRTVLSGAVESDILDDIECERILSDRESAKQFITGRFICTVMSVACRSWIPYQTRESWHIEDVIERLSRAAVSVCESNRREDLSIKG